MKTILSNGKCPTELNFGCGSNILEGYWNVDLTIKMEEIYKDYGNTWISEGKVLSPHALPKNHFSFIRAEMVMEHIHPDMIPNTLYCLYHFLKPKGELEIIVPNFIKLAQRLVENERYHKDCIDANMEYVDVLRNVNNEFLDPTFEDIGFHHGHQSIWTPKLAKRWLENEGYSIKSIEPFGKDFFYLEIMAEKPENNNYGSPNK